MLWHTACYPLDVVVSPGNGRSPSHILPGIHQVPNEPSGPSFRDERITFVEFGMATELAVGQNGVHGVEIFVPTVIVKRDGRIVSFEIRADRERAAPLLRQLRPHAETPVVRAGQSRRQHHCREVERRAADRRRRAGHRRDGAPGGRRVRGRQALHPLPRRARQEARGAARFPDDVRAGLRRIGRYFPTPLQKFQFFDKYSRFDYDLGRRETWIETVDRAVDFLHELAGDAPAGRETYERIRQAILEMRSMPSMRLLAMAGPAARRNNITIYNCSYQPVESIDSFCEALIISMSGCGVGFSVESQLRRELPAHQAPDRHARRSRTSSRIRPKAGPTALRAALETWFEGGDMRFDLRSSARPARR